MDRCSTSSGVVVAVDFGPWHGPIVRGCGSTPTTGYQLINQGGFATTGTAHDGPGFICRISYTGFNGGIGEPADQKCIYTPPANASWTYWTASPNEHAWTASSTGAANTYPVAGAVQAWTFGDGSYPSFSPDSVRAPNKAPASSSPVSKGAGSTAPVSSPAVGSIRAVSSQPTAANRTTGLPASQPAIGAARRPASSPVTSTPGTSVNLTGGSAVPSSSPNIVNAQPDSAPRSKGSGSALPVLATGVIVLGLAGLAGFTAWHRRAG